MKDVYEYFVVKYPSGKYFCRDSSWDADFKKPSEQACCTDHIFLAQHFKPIEVVGIKKLIRTEGHLLYKSKLVRVKQTIEYSTEVLDA